MDLDPIREAAERVARSMGLEIFDVEWKVGKQRLLRVYIDRLPDAANPGYLGNGAGVSHSDCESVSEQLSVILDVEDLVPGPRYILEVSSPGLDRKLIRPAEFERFAGRLANIWLNEPVENQKYFRRPAGGICRRHGEADGARSGGCRAVRRDSQSEPGCGIVMGGSEEKQGWRVCCTRRLSRSAGKSTSNRRSSSRPLKTRWWSPRGNITSTEEDLRSKFNPETGQIDVFSVHTVVEEVTDPMREISLAEARKQNPDIEVGGEITAPKPTDVLGRIAAQTAKQVILQKVREAERDTIYNELQRRVGELVNCVVKRTEGPDVIVDLGRTEARLPKREQSRLETYNVGDRLRVMIRAVERAAKGPQVIVSRADPVLVQRLFEMEVPEIYDGTVQIRAVAREAGERTKIARAEPRQGCGSGGRVRGHEGHARAVHHPRIARRKNRHHSL